MADYKVAFRRNALAQGNRAQRAILRYGMSVTMGARGDKEIIGKGAPHETAGGVEWPVFHSNKWTYEDLANLGTLCSGLPSVSEAWADDKTRAEIRDAARAFVVNNRVWPVVIPDDEVDPAAYVLAQQGAPSWVRATSLPIEDLGLTPKVAAA